MPRKHSRRDDRPRSEHTEAGHGEWTIGKVPRTHDDLARQMFAEGAVMASTILKANVVGGPVHCAEFLIRLDITSRELELVAGEIALLLADYWNHGAHYAVNVRDRGEGSSM